MSYSSRDTYGEQSPLGKWQADVASGLAEYLRVLEKPVGFAVLGDRGCGKTGLLRALSLKLGVGPESIITPSSKGELPEKWLDPLGDSWLIVDHLDAAEPGVALGVIRELARRVVAAPKGASTDCGIVLGCNLRRMRTLLGPLAGGEDEAEDLLATVASQRFFPSRPDPDIAVETFWPAENVNPAREEADELGTVVLRRWLRSFPTGNLRQLRQFAVQLDYFRGSYGLKPYKAVRKKDPADPRERLICQQVFLLIILLRERLPVVYQEWISSVDQMETILSALAALEAGFSRAPAGFYPDTLWQGGGAPELKRLRGAGLKATAQALSSPAASLVLVWREFREGLLPAMFPLPRALTDPGGLSDHAAKYLGGTAGSYWTAIRPARDEIQPETLLGEPNDLLPLLEAGEHRGLTKSYLQEVLKQ